MKVLKKLSHKELNNTTPEVLKAMIVAHHEAEGTPLFVARIIGIVRSQSVVDTTYGASLKFAGEFRGWGIDGEEAFSPVAFLPSPFDNLLSQQINDLQGEDGAKKVSVEFGLDIFAVPDKAAVGYKFIVKPLTEAKPSDPLGALMSSFAPLQIAAPAQAAIGQEKPVDAPVEEEKPADAKPEGKGKASK